MKVIKNPEIDPELQRLGQLEPFVPVLCFGVGVVLDFCLLLICVCICVYICIYVCTCALECSCEGQKWMPDVLIMSYVLR